MHLASLILLSYNQATYIREAALSVLGQECEPIEILLSDDNSSDCTYDILQELAHNYRGKHLVKLNRNQSNLGISAHFQKAATLTTGRWVIAAAGDDVSASNRVKAVLEHAKKQPDLRVITSKMHFVSETGEISSQDDRYVSAMKSLQYLSFRDLMTSIRKIKESYFKIIGACATWNRDVFNLFPPLPNDKMVNEDIVLTWRAMMLGKACFIDEDLVGYRRHALSVSNNMNLGAKLGQNSKVIWQAYLRTRASLKVTLSDIDHAKMRGYISESDYAQCRKSLTEYIDFRDDMMGWGESTALNRALIVMKYWRFGYLRPSPLSIFSN